MEFSNKRKSRDQKFFEYFITLQKEYIVAEIRKKIYPDIKGKVKSEEIMAGKKKKIFDIAMKNNLKTIFPDMKVGGVSLYDEKLRIKLYREIYKDKGLPEFIYRDETQKQKLGFKDKKYYFCLGSDFKVGDDVGILQQVDFNKELVYIKLKSEIKEYPMSEVSRIL